ncbi:histidine phosphatase family protein [Gudongella sp. DL1XJH-153]|uniref:histidine phosphatase family protein n=1 Tax=Gudongella sp. DL1XJH-153 TaxID=3409804 RepID=UPI003BB7A497
MDIIFIRHGESHDNLEKRFSRDFTTLTEEGIEQIKNTRTLLEKYHFSKVYVSPLKRTLQTLSYLGLQGEEDDRIREMNFGVFAGLTFQEYQKDYPQETKLWMEDSFNYTIPEGENITDTYKRVESFMVDLLDRNENVLVVTHEGIIRLACCWVIGSSEHFFRFRIENASLTVISADKDYRYIKKLNHK